MPSQLHESLLLLFRNRPTLAPELLRDALHVELPVFTEARVDSADLTEVQPAEYRAHRSGRRQPFRAASARPCGCARGDR